MVHLKHQKWHMAHFLIFGHQDTTHSWFSSHSLTDAFQSHFLVSPNISKAQSLDLPILPFTLWVIMPCVMDLYTFIYKYIH